MRSEKSNYKRERERERERKERELRTCGQNHNILWEI